MFKAMLVTTLGGVLAFIVSLPFLIIAALIICFIIWLVNKIEMYIDDKRHGRR